jgi:hypothetical protein
MKYSSFFPNFADQNTNLPLSPNVHFSQLYTTNNYGVESKHDETDHGAKRILDSKF